MKFQQFGTTGIRVSEIGFGGSRIGGVFADRRSSSKEALTVIRKALDCGITFYDTANIYAQGESESLIGNALHDRRRQAVFATKGGYCLPARRNLIRRIKPLVRPIVRALGLKGTQLRAAMAGSLSQDFSRAHLTAALEASLKRLRTDYVDLYQLHSPSVPFMEGPEFGEALDTLERLKQHGKLRFYGVATESAEAAASCLRAPGISSVQLAFGLLDPEVLDQGILASARARGLAVIARGCFAGGLLSDKRHESELRATTPKCDAILNLRAFCKDMNRSVLDTAVQFCRATPEVSVTLLGMRLEDQLRQNLRYLESPALAAEEYSALRRQPIGSN